MACLEILELPVKGHLKTLSKIKTLCLKFLNYNLNDLQRIFFLNSVVLTNILGIFYEQTLFLFSRIAFLRLVEMLYIRRWIESYKQWLAPLLIFICFFYFFIGDAKFVRWTQLLNKVCLLSINVNISSDFFFLRYPLHK